MGGLLYKFPVYNGRIVELFTYIENTENTPKFERKTPKFGFKGVWIEEDLSHPPKGVK